MRRVTEIVWHYSATYEDADIGVKEIDLMHRARGFNGIGYHYVVRLDGTVEVGRAVERVGAHVLNQNSDKIGCVHVGGLRHGFGTDKGFDTRNSAQIASQIKLTRELIARFPTIVKVKGHKDYMATQCPAYDVAAWWESVNGKMAPLPAPVVSTPMLKLGSKGHVVRRLQEALNTRGYSAGIADGIFGQMTLRAVLAFQSAAQILPDGNGKVGPVTWTTLFKEK